MLNLGGAKDTLVVSRGYANLVPPYYDLQVFDHGILRPGPSYTRFASPSYELELLRGTEDPNQVLAMTTHSTNPQLCFFHLTDGGLALDRLISNPVAAETYSWPENFLYASGRLYFANGVVLDATDGTHLGQLPGGFGTRNRLVVDTLKNKAYFWSETMNDPRICVSDTRTYEPIGSKVIDTVGDVFVTNFVACGSGLVAVTTPDSLYVFPVDDTGVNIVPTITELQAWPSSPSQGSSVTLTFYLKNTFDFTVRGAQSDFKLTPTGASPGSVTFTPSRTTTYTVVARDTMGLATTQDFTVTVPNTTPIPYLDLPIKDMVASKADDLLYASIDSNGGAYANSIVAIDPQTRTVVKSIFVGSSPRKIALSEDGTILYVNVLNAGTICPIHLPDMTLGTPFPLGVDPNFGLRYAGDICPVPGQKDSVIVSQDFFGITPPFALANAYDAGIPRALTLIPALGALDVIQPSDTAGTFFGYENGSTTFYISKFSLAPDGLHLIDHQPAGSSAGNGRFLSGFGKLFFTDGTVLDAGNFSLIEKLPVTYSSNGNAVALDKTAHQVYLNDGNGFILSYDALTLAPTGSFNLGAPSSNMIRWGQTGLAILTLDRLYFVDISQFQ